MQLGLPLKSPLAEKLWRVGEVLKRSPFDDYILNHTTAQLDFILAKFAEDNSDKWRFERGMAAIPSVEIKAAWERALTGTSRHDMLNRAMPSAAVLRAAQEIAAAANLLKKAAGAKH